MSKFGEFVSGFFTKASPARQPRPVDAPQIGPVPEYLLSTEKIKDLTVAISSPLTGLDTIRSQMAKFINGIDGVRCITFESAPQGGVHPAVASKDIVERADLLVILIADSRGTTDTSSAQTYSQIEFEETKKQQDAYSGRPRVLVYVQEKMERTRTAWEQEAMSRHNYTLWNDPEALPLDAFRDISALLLAERQQQCSAIRDLYVRQLNRRMRLVGLFKSVVEQRNSARREFAAATGTASEWLRSAERLLAAALQKERGFGWRIAGWSLTCVAFGALLVTIANPPVAGTLAIESPSLRQGAAALSRLAEQGEALPAHVQAKVTLARTLSSKFECSARTVTEWPVDGVPGAWFSRRDVCEGYGALRISVALEAQRCESATLSVDEMRRLVVLLARSNVRVDAIRILGHASTEAIHGNCGRITEQLRTCDPAFQLSDLTISNNDKLAEARAHLAACRLRAEFVAQGVSPSPRIIPEGAGTLFALESTFDGAKHRRLDIEIFASALMR